MIRKPDTPSLARGLAAILLVIPSNVRTPPAPQCRSLWRHDDERFAWGTGARFARIERIGPSVRGAHSYASLWIGMAGECFGAERFTRTGPLRFSTAPRPHPTSLRSSAPTWVVRCCDGYGWRLAQIESGKRSRISSQTRLEAAGLLPSLKYSAMPRQYIASAVSGPSGWRSSTAFSRARQVS